MDEQVELLRAIRDEMRALNGRVDLTNAALHSEIGGLRTEVTEQLDALRSEFRGELFSLRKEHKSEVRRSVERDIGLGTAVTDLQLAVRELTAVIHAWRDEHRIDREDLRERVARLERRVGLEPP